MSRIRRLSQVISEEGRRALASQQASRIRDTAFGIVDEANLNASTSRKITKKAAFTVVLRSLQSTRNLPFSLREHMAIKELSQYITLAQSDKSNSLTLSNTDLLPVSHPRSTRNHAMTASALLEARARWVADDPRIVDGYAKTIIASALTSKYASVEHVYYNSILSSLPQGVVPAEVIVAASNPFSGGNSSAERSLRARLQRRDRYGRFAFMGGGLSALVRRSNGRVYNLVGRPIIDGPNGDDIQMELPDGRIVNIPASKGMFIKAVINPTPDGYSKDTAKTATTGNIINEEDLVFVDAPKGWSKTGTNTWSAEDGWSIEKGRDKNGFFQYEIKDPAGKTVGTSSGDWEDALDSIAEKKEGKKAVLPSDNINNIVPKKAPVEIGGNGEGPKPPKPFEFKYPEGAVKIKIDESYEPEGRNEEESPDFTDDPVELGQKFDPRDLIQALEQGVIPQNKGENAIGYGVLRFNGGDEYVPVQAIYNALDEAGEDAPLELARIYDKGLGNNSNENALKDNRKGIARLDQSKPDVAESFERTVSMNPDEVPATKTPKFSEAEMNESSLPPVLEGLSEAEMRQFMETGDHTPYLPENESIDMPEGYNSLDPSPFSSWREVTADTPDAVLPEGFSDNPVFLAQSIDRQSLETELRRSIEPDSATPGYANISLQDEDGEEFVANVPGEAVRDALQLQGVDTNELIKSIADEGFAGQEDQIIMDPPKDGGQDIKDVDKALDFLDKHMDDMGTTEDAAMGISQAQEHLKEAKKDLENGDIKSAISSLEDAFNLMDGLERPSEGIFPNGENSAEAVDVVNKLITRLQEADTSKTSGEKSVVEKKPMNAYERLMAENKAAEDAVKERKAKLDKDAQDRVDDMGRPIPEGWGFTTKNKPNFGQLDRPDNYFNVYGNNNFEASVDSEGKILVKDRNGLVPDKSYDNWEDLQADLANQKAEYSSAARARVAEIAKGYGYSDEQIASFDSMSQQELADFFANPDNHTPAYADALVDWVNSFAVDLPNPQQKARWAQMAKDEKILAQAGDAPSKSVEDLLIEKPALDKLVSEINKKDGYEANGLNFRINTGAFGVKDDNIEVTPINWEPGDPIVARIDMDGEIDWENDAQFDKYANDMNEALNGLNTPEEINDEALLDRRLAGESLDVVAEDLGISREEVRRREMNALRKRREANPEAPLAPTGLDKPENKEAIAAFNRQYVKELLDQEEARADELQAEGDGMPRGDAQGIAEAEMKIMYGKTAGEALDELPREEALRVLRERQHEFDKDVVPDISEPPTQSNVVLAVDVNSPNLQEEIQSAIDKGQKIAFSYNGKERVVLPKGIWTNPKNGNVNLRAIEDGTDGGLKVFTLNKMEMAAPPPPRNTTKPKELSEGDKAVIKNNAFVEENAGSLQPIAAEDVQVGDFIWNAFHGRYEEVLSNKYAGVMNRMEMEVFNVKNGQREIRYFEMDSPLRNVRRPGVEDQAEPIPSAKAAPRGGKRNVIKRKAPSERVVAKEGRQMGGNFEKEGFYRDMNGVALVPGDVVIHRDPSPGKGGKWKRGVVKLRIGAQVEEGKKAGAVGRKGIAYLDYLIVQWEGEDVEAALNQGGRQVKAKNLVKFDGSVDGMVMPEFRGGNVKPNTPANPAAPAKPNVRPGVPEKIYNNKFQDKNGGNFEINLIKIDDVYEGALIDRNVAEDPQDARVQIVVRDKDKKVAMNALADARDIIKDAANGQEALPDIPNLDGEFLGDENLKPTQALEQGRLLDTPEGRPAAPAGPGMPKPVYKAEVEDEKGNNFKISVIKIDDMYEAAVFNESGDLNAVIAKNTSLAEVQGVVGRFIGDVAESNDGDKVIRLYGNIPEPVELVLDKDNITNENLNAALKDVQARLSEGPNDWRIREAQRAVEKLIKDLDNGIDPMSLSITRLGQIFTGLGASSNASYIELAKKLKPIFQVIIKKQREKQVPNRKANLNKPDPVALANERVLAGENIVDAPNVKDIFTKDDVFAANPFLEPFKEELQGFFAPAQGQPLAKLSAPARQALNQYLSGSIRDVKVLKGSTPEQTDSNIREVADFILALRKEELAYSPNRDNIDVAQALKGMDPEKIFKYGNEEATQEFVPLIIDGVDTGFLMKLNERGVNAGNGNNFWLIDTNSGQKLIIKRETIKGRSDAEVWSAKLLNALGVRGVSHVERHPKDKDILFVAFAGDNLDLKTTPNVYDVVRNDLNLYAEKTAARAKVADLIGMMIFDGVASNTDRHEENFLAAETPRNGVAGNGHEDLQLLPIDHGYAHRLSRRRGAIYDPETLLRTNGYATSRLIYQELVKSIGGRATHHLVDLTVQQAIQELKRDNGGIDSTVLKEVIAQLEVLRGITPEKWAKFMKARE